jgi:hypothetical protein
MNITVRMKIEQVEKYDVAIDYQPLHERFQYYKSLFDRMSGYAQPSSKAEMIIAFDTIMNAGARPMQDGTNVITVASGMFNFARWFSLRQFYDDIFPHLRPSDVDRQIKLTPKDQRILSSVMISLKTLSHVIVNGAIKMSLDDEQKSHASEALVYFEELLQSAEFNWAHVKERSNWLAAEVFVLCHEFGHINLGHLDELRDWQQSPAKSRAEIAARRARRKQMENEADSFAMGNMVVMMSHILKKNYDNPLAADEDPDRERDYLMPVVDLFSIYEIAQRETIDFASPNCEYPSNQERLHYLLARGGFNSQDAIANVMQRMTFL